MNLKNILIPFIAAFTLPAFAVDPHDAQVATAALVTAQTTTTPQTVNIATLTSHAVGSGTNSYLVIATLHYSAPAFGQVALQLSQTVSSVTTPIASTVRKIGNEGDITIITEIESVATSTGINLSALVNNSGVPVTFSNATLTIIGLSGNTQ